MNFSLTLDLSERGSCDDVHGNPYNGYRLSLYENGVLVLSSYLNIEQWDAFGKKCRNDRAEKFFLGCGRDSYNGKFYVGYEKMILKNCRFYTRPLSSDEIKLNYDTRLAYDREVDEY